MTTREDADRIEVLRLQALNAPQEPGVYLMRDETRTVLYVGKAKSLRDLGGNDRKLLPHNSQ